jgi:long-chain acyl-CoA synthetase
VISTDPNVTAKDIKDFCRESLTGYKLPKYIEFRTELPMTPVGKILRRELKDEEAAKTKGEAQPA